MDVAGYLDPDGWPVLEFDQPSVLPVPVPATPAALVKVVATVAPPTPADLARFLGWPPLDVEGELAAQSHLDRALLVVTNYVRGRGRTGDHLNADLAAVVLSLAGRTMANPTGASRIDAGTYRSSPGQPEFLLSERLLMDTYRRRTA